MTTWTARRPKTGDQRRVLCGRVVDGQYDCPEIVAWMPSGSIPGEPPAFVFVLPGMTDADSPGRWRWSSETRRRLAGDHSREPHPGRTIGVLKGGISQRGTLPCTMPCRKGHENRLQGDVLAG
jgi:hypothetical protein